MHIKETFNIRKPLWKDVSVDEHNLISTGRTFHICGAHTSKALPSVLVRHGMEHEKIHSERCVCVNEDCCSVDICLSKQCIITSTEELLSQYDTSQCGYGVWCLFSYRNDLSCMCIINISAVLEDILCYTCSAFTLFTCSTVWH